MKLSSAIVSMVIVGAVCISGTTLYFQKNTMSSSAAPAFNTQAAKTLITKATGDRAVVMQTFTEGPFQGFVLKGSQPNSPQGILFTDATGEYLISGNLMNQDLKSLTEQAFDKYVNPEKAKTAWASVSVANAVNYVTVGKDSAPHKLYVVADPNCVFCHQFYSASKSYVDSGQLQIRWIFGAFLKDSSQGRAAAILGASDPVAALAQNETGFIDASEEGGIAPMATISPELTAKIQANMNFMVKNQFMQTPTLLYKDAAGVPTLYTGLPDAKQTAALINSMGSSF